MTKPQPRSPGRRPVDPLARERLRDAQAAESRAVARYLAASDKVAAVASELAGAKARLADALRAVIEVSGSPRAMVLLGLDRAGLRALTAPKVVS